MSTTLERAWGGGACCGRKEKYYRSIVLNKLKICSTGLILEALLRTSGLGQDHFNALHLPLSDVFVSFYSENSR